MVSINFQDLEIEESPKLRLIKTATLETANEILNEQNEKLMTLAGHISKAGCEYATTLNHLWTSLTSPEVQRHKKSEIFEELAKNIGEIKKYFDTAKKAYGETELLIKAAKSRISELTILDL